MTAIGYNFSMNVVVMGIDFRSVAHYLNWSRHQIAETQHRRFTRGIRRPILKPPSPVFTMVFWPWCLNGHNVYGYSIPQVLSDYVDSFNCYINQDDSSRKFLYVKLSFRFLICQM